MANPVLLDGYEDSLEMWRKTWQIIISCSTPYKRFTRCRPLTAWPARGKSDRAELSITHHLWSTSEGGQTAITVSFLAKSTGADLDDTPDSLYKRRFGYVALRRSVQLVTAVGSPGFSIGAFSKIDRTTRDIVSQSVNIVFQLRQPVLTRRRQQTVRFPSSYLHTCVYSVAVTSSTDSQRQAEFYVITNVSKCIIRPNFETDTPIQTVRTIPPGMRFSTNIVALKRFLQVPLDDTSVNLALVLLHNQVVFGQALHQQAVGHPWSYHRSSSTRLPYPNSSWADFYWRERRFFFAHIPAFPTPRLHRLLHQSSRNFSSRFSTGSAQSSVPDGSVCSTSSTSFYTSEAATILLLSGGMDTRAPVNSCFRLFTFVVFHFVCCFCF
jgi:hypothetical protein